MYLRVEWPLVVLHSSLREVSMFRRSQFGSVRFGSTAAAWQCGLSQVIQVGAVQVGTLLDPRCVAVAFPAAWQWLTERCVAVAFPATWQWPIKRITDIFLAGASVTP